MIRSKATAAESPQRGLRASLRGDSKTPSWRGSIRQEGWLPRRSVPTRTRTARTLTFRLPASLLRTVSVLACATICSGAYPSAPCAAAALYRLAVPASPHPSWRISILTHYMLWLPLCDGPEQRGDSGSDWAGSIQDPANELRRKSLPRTRVNKGIKKGWGSRPRPFFSARCGTITR